MMMKNKLAVLFLVLALSLPVYSVEDDADYEKNEITIEDSEQIPVTESDVSNQESNIENELTKDSFKQPVSKRNIAKKFILAMGGVGASSLLIFLCLSLYNKIRGQIKTVILDEEDEPSPLETPDTLNGAIKSFLNKTHWDN